MEIVLLLLVLAFGIGMFAFWIWSIVDIIRSDFKKESDKIVWLVLVVGLHLLGSVLYVIFGTQQKAKPIEDIVWQSHHIIALPVNERYPTDIF